MIKQVIFALSILAGLLAIVLQSIGMLGIVCLCVLVETVLIYRQYNQAQSRVDQGEITGASLPQSRNGLISQVEALKFQLNNLSSQLSLAKESELADSSVLGNLGSLALKDDLNSGSADSQQAQQNSVEDHFLSSAVTSAQTRFKATACAVLFSSNENQELKLISAGVRGAKFESCMRYYFKSYFLNGDNANFGQKDFSETGSILGDFSIFGFRYIVSLPFKVPSGVKGVVWLGFGQNARPVELIVEVLERFIKRLESEFEAARKLHELSAGIEEAKNLNQAKDQFIAYMSHDIRTPLNNVKAILSLLKIEGPNADNQQMLDTAINNCDQMGEIVEDILDFSRYQAGRLIAKMEDVDLQSNVIDVLNSFSYTARTKGLYLKIDPILPQIMINVDVRHMKRILINVMSNALKYTKQGGVSVSVRSNDQNSHSIVIKDTGVGMTKEQLQLLFTPFTRFSNSIAASGVGLGLALSKVLAELNQAKIIVNSEYGQGTEFELRFLASGAQTSNIKIPHTQSAQISLAPSTPIPMRSQAKQNAAYEKVVTPDKFKYDRVLQRLRSEARILVVDDDIDCASSLERALKLSGFEAMFASGVRDAISIVNFEKPDLIISDSNMPDGGGRRILSTIATYQYEVPVLIMSGDDSEEEKADYINHGARALMAKPINIAELVNWIDKQLNLIEKAKERSSQDSIAKVSNS